MVEYVVRRRRPTDLRRIAAAGSCVVVRTECGDPIERFARHHQDDRLLYRQPVLDTLRYATIDDHLRAALVRMRSVARDRQTDFDLPTLVVNGGYDPDLDVIIAFAITGTRPLA